MSEIIQFEGKRDGFYMAEEVGDPRWHPEPHQCAGGRTEWVVVGRSEITAQCEESANFAAWAYLEGFKVRLFLCEEHAEAMDVPTIPGACA